MFVYYIVFTIMINTNNSTNNRMDKSAENEKN